jgi:hypothetical protein
VLDRRSLTRAAGLMRWFGVRGRDQEISIIPPRMKGNSNAYF